jgi:hypothetical protein
MAVFCHSWRSSATPVVAEERHLLRVRRKWRTRARLGFRVLLRISDSGHEAGSTTRSSRWITSWGAPSGRSLVRDPASSVSATEL